MGITRHCIELLDDIRHASGPLESLLTLGRQNLLLSQQDRKALSRTLPVETGGHLRDVYAEPLLAALLGSAACQSMDASDYEGADLVHDLNQPVPAALLDRFDLIVDGGTLEHVFDQATALRNIRSMLRPGGVFVSHTIANGFCGHGLYQFSPELFYRAFSARNGFVDACVFAQPLSSSTMAIAAFGGWYRVADPDGIQERVLHSAGRPLSLYVVARKRLSPAGPDGALEVMQSDYSALWRAGEGHPGRSRRWRAVVLARRVPLLGTLAIHVADQLQLRLARSLLNRRFYHPLSAEQRRAQVSSVLSAKEEPAALEQLPRAA